jgi:hypothetical protein
MLDEYAARFPGGVLAPEGAVLRVEALLSRGDRAAAVNAADAFARAYPSSPYVGKLRTLLEKNR